MTPIATAIALVFAAVAGSCVAAQAGINAQLGRALGHPLWASLVSFGIGTTLVLPLLALGGVPAPNFAAALNGPWWIWIGGAMGLFFVTAALILAPKTGVAAFLAAMIAGQLIAALLLDHYGLLGLAVRPVTFARAAGTALIIVGVMVMQFQRS